MDRVASGLISALAFNSDGTGTFAAGSYSGTVSIYSEETGEDRLAEVNLGEISAGITQVSLPALFAVNLAYSPPGELRFS
jgi:hypothetical protein